VRQDFLRQSQRAFVAEETQDPFSGQVDKLIEGRSLSSEVNVHLVTDYDESTDLQARIWNQFCRQNRADQAS